MTLKFCCQTSTMFRLTRSSRFALSMAPSSVRKRVQLGLNCRCVDLPALLEPLGDHGGSVGRAVDDRTVGLARRRWMMRTQRVTARSPQSRDSFQAAGEPPSAVDLDG